MGVRFPPGVLKDLSFLWWLWCSGSTQVCGTFSSGSIPDSHPAKPPNIRQKIRLRKRSFFIGRNIDKKAIIWYIYISYIFVSTFYINQINKLNDEVCND
jgi:hypothetical protein